MRAVALIRTRMNQDREAGLPQPAWRRADGARFTVRWRVVKGEAPG